MILLVFLIVVLEKPLACLGNGVHDRTGTRAAGQTGKQVDIEHSSHFFLIHFLHGTCQFEQKSIDVRSEQDASRTAFLVGRRAYGTNSSLCLGHIAQQPQQFLVSLRIAENGIHIAVRLDVHKFIRLETTVPVYRLIADIVGIQHGVVRIHINKTDGQAGTLLLVKLGP